MTNTYPITATKKQNRAIRYTRENADGTRSVITADYDYMGRRAWKKVESITPNPETGEETTTVLMNHRHIYRGYQQIATCDLTRAAHPYLWRITWDPPSPSPRARWPSKKTGHGTATGGT